MNLHKEIDNCFSPDDTYVVMEVAHRALFLLETNQKIIDAYDSGVGITKEEVGELLSRMLMLGQALQLIGDIKDTANIKIFQDKLRGR